MPHKTLHDRESIMLSILTFGEFLTEPLDCNVVMRKSSQTLDLIFHVCRVENATLVVKHQTEYLITLPNIAFLFPSNKFSLWFTILPSVCTFPWSYYPLHYENQNKLVAPSDCGLMMRVCVERMISFIWTHDPAAGTICLHLAQNQTFHG